MLALYRSGRQADALAAYRDARQTLVATLGIEPGPPLRRLERAILEQDPGLDVPADRPPRAVQPTRSLRSRPSTFVGRKRELRDLRALLGREDVRLLTLTGAAGSGKTRLAVETVGDLDTGAGETPIVELAPITDASLVPGAIADRLGVRVRPGLTPVEALLEHLCDRRTRLLLDNFEQVLAAAPALETLLAGAPGLQLLVTSRTPLGIRAERIHPVSPLELPDPSRPRTLARLKRTESVRLFCERAREARHGFELTEANADDVAQVCVRLDGLPLALELAAARSRVLAPGALLARLDSSLDLLRAAPGSGLSERQWTLRGAIEWSYELLDPGQQQLFVSLGVFLGGFTLSGAELVAGRPEQDTLEGVESLLRSNLLTAKRTRVDEPRLGMLETIREYALERLAARGDGDAVRRRHAAFCLGLAEEAEPGLRGPHQLEWLERLDDERDNMRAALAWALQAGEAELGLGIAWSLWRFWQLRNRMQEGRRWLEELLALGTGSPATRAKAGTIFGQLSGVLGDVETARLALEESLQMHRRLGDSRMVACALLLLGKAEQIDGDVDAAVARTREGLGVAREAGETYEESAALWQLGSCLAARGEVDEAERTLGQAVGLARKRGDTRSVALGLQTLGGLAIARGDHDRARRLFEEGLTAQRSLGDPWGISHSLAKLAFLALEAGDIETARSLVSELLAIQRESDHRPLLANALELSARLAASDGRLERAVQIHASAAPLRESVGPHSTQPGWPDPIPHIDELRSALGDAGFDVAWARGSAMTVREAIESALEVASLVSRERPAEEPAPDALVSRG
jgi:predicted ATPase